MNNIKCPKCGEVFAIDEGDYAALLAQVRDEQFEKELKARLEASVELAKHKAAEESSRRYNDYEKKISELQSQLASLSGTNKLLIEQEKLRHEAEIGSLKAKLDSNEKDIALAVSKAENAQKEEISKLKSEIESLKGKISVNEANANSTLLEATARKEADIQKLQLELAAQKDYYLEQGKANEEAYRQNLKAKDEQIAFYKDLKTRMSTKLLGETLEQHCLIEFNKLRPTAFQNVYFDKDNDASSGSKGDFIYREKTEEGAELLSIMFEMKNEADETASKHKNSDFYKELDKDRKEKGCEYAILVSTLEPESDYFNAGIVDVSYESGYEKMYVVRPQCFIPIITLLRNAASKAKEYKNQVEILKNQDIDITNFEDKLLSFKDAFSGNVEKAKAKFEAAIAEIDKAIKDLYRVRDDLTASEKQLSLANSKVDGITIRKLTYGNPTMKAKFAELAKEEDK